MVEKDQISTENVDISDALELLRVLVTSQELSNIASGVIWDFLILILKQC